MGAPIGNEFYKLRLKHGRNNAIETPEQLWANFEEYCQWISQNSLIEVDYRGKDADRVEIPKMRTLSKDGFALACGLSGWEIINDYRKNRKDFSEIVTRIEKYIQVSKLEGAAAGMLNPSIIARELGLKEQTDITTDNKPLGGVIKWGEKEIQI